MQKVLDLLEKHVQWVALGLGALWLLFMAWSYVINPPAKVMIGSADLKAAAVDEYTLKNAVGPLENEMKPGKEVPAMQVDQFAERWQERMEWKGAEPISLAGIVWSKVPIPPAIIDMNRQPGPIGPIVPQGPGPGPGPGLR